MTNRNGELWTREKVTMMMGRDEERKMQARDWMKNLGKPFQPINGQYRAEETSWVKSKAEPFSGTEIIMRSILILRTSRPSLSEMS